ncbi:MAG: aminopeptidase P family protein [Sneathiellaceae bacterium]
MTVDISPDSVKLLCDLHPGLSAQGARAWAAGVAASPDRFGTRQGLDLLAAAAPAEKAARLAREVEALAAQWRDGLGDRQQSAGRLDRVRQELAAQELDGFIVPMTDAHQGEYLPRQAERLAWLTGFTGSAGMAIVLHDKAGVWSDGRYTLQLRDQVDTALFSLHHITEAPPHDWLARQAAGQRIGYDPWLHTPDGLARWRRAAGKAGIELVAVEQNPIDRAWDGQPPPPLAPVRPHTEMYTGRPSAAKRAEIAALLAEAGDQAAVLSLPESIAWLFNIRGGDVPRAPFPHAFAILHADETADLFLDRRKMTAELRPHLGNGVTLHPPEKLGAALDRLGRDKALVRLDPASAPAWIAERLEAAGARLDRNPDPCLAPKAQKNPVELNGMRAAHLRDGAAVTRFLKWLAGAGPGGQVDEMTAAAQLEAFRRSGRMIQDLSFDTISGAGPNGAIVHYRVTPASNRKLEPGSLFLVDSGAQYLDGTTDITRTVAIGTPDAEMRDRFTRVLKGHIALAMALFPRGTSGGQLDSLARAALWQAGLDYDHGTGHGVGSYLGVHEGPQRISKAGGGAALVPGMILSNEPGYYKEGAYGIRIENLVAVMPVEVPGAEREMLGFETLTRAPIDRALVDPGLLSRAEIAWLDDYHATVRDSLTPLLDKETADWLAVATAPLGEAAAGQ